MLTLTRPANGLIGAASIAVGALATGIFSPLSHILLASLSGGLIIAAANIINDVFDIEIDRINKPHRPLAAGLISPALARSVSHVLFVLGILIAALIGFSSVAIALLAAVLLYAYSARLKQTVLWGNLTVSLLSALAFIYGGTAVANVGLSVIPAAFAFLFHLGREVLKDIEDVPGDLQNNIETLPIRFGQSAAIWFITFIFVLLILLTFLPYIFGVYGWFYLLLVIPGVDFYLIYVLISIRRDPSIRNCHRLSRGLKLNMLMGLAAILAGVRLA